MGKPLVYPIVIQEGTTRFRAALRFSDWRRGPFWDFGSPTFNTAQSAAHMALVLRADVLFDQGQAAAA